MEDDDRYAEVTAEHIHVESFTPAKFRELALAKMLGSGPGMNKALLPTPQELDTMSDMLYEAVSAGKFIDFGHWPNDFIKKASMRGGDLYAERALGHPFVTPWVFFHTWNDEVDDKMLGWEQKNCSAYLVNPFPKDGVTLACDVEVVEIMVCDVLGERMMIVGDRAILMPDAPRPVNTKYACHVVPATLRFPQEFWDEYATMVGKEPGIQGSLHSAASNVLDPFCVALLLLNTRGIPTTIVKADDKLNRARIKNRKPPIPSYRQIDSLPYVTSMLRQPRIPGVDRGGHHASPVPHIRQGHWRNYKTGERTFINDTLVKATPEMREMFKAQRAYYKVKE